MRHFILATHMTMARGMEAVIRLIMGENENFTVVCAYTEECMDVKKALSEAVERCGDEDVVIMTDLFGGSVNNEALEFLNRGNVYLVAGVNLPFVIRLLTTGEEVSTDRAIAESLKEARDGIVYCNEALTDNGEMDEF